MSRFLVFLKDLISLISIMIFCWSALIWLAYVTNL